MSIASKTITTRLTSVAPLNITEGEFFNWVSFNMKVCIFLSMFCLLISLLNMIFNTSTTNELDTLDTLRYEPPNIIMCQCDNNSCKCNQSSGTKLNGNDFNSCMEEFSNTSNPTIIPINDNSFIELENDITNTLSPYSSKNILDYGYAELVPPIDENRNPSNMFVGKAYRYIIDKDTKVMYRLNIVCNLSILDGNVYNNNKSLGEQKYNVFLYDSKNKTHLFLEELKKDNDGLYKLDYKIEGSDRKKIKEMSMYDTIKVMYVFDKKYMELILTGRLRSNK